MTNVCVKDINQSILSADELINLRKPHDLTVPESFREKGYIPTEVDKSHVTSLLEEQKKMLDHKSVARIADLIQAEWDSDSKRAITKKLKGKTQHMGISVGRKVSLSPEEVIFLLENGNLELRLNDVPLSTECAHAKVLIEDLALENYLVYSHLSRLGYIVVQHQKDVDLVQKEKLHTQGKCHCKKKRKQLETNMSSRKKVRLSNGFSVEQRTVPPCELSSDTSLKVSPDHSNGENSSLELTQKKLDKVLGTTIDVSEDTSTCMNSSENHSIEQTPHISSNAATDNENLIVENNSASTVTSVDDEKIGVESVRKSSMPGMTELIPGSNIMAGYLEANPSSTSTSPDVVKSKASKYANNNDDVICSEHTTEISAICSDKVKEDRNSDNEVDITITSENSAESSKEISDAQEVIIECSENKSVKNLGELSKHSQAEEIAIIDDEKICTSNGTDAITSNVKLNQIEVVGDFIESELHKYVENVKNSHANVFRIDDGTSDDSDTTSDSDILYVDELNNEESAQSCEETDEDSIQSVSVDEAIEVEDVMVVQVNKKQVEPLAVINLSSDEDSQLEKDANDDEVLILEECSTVKPLCKEDGGWLLASSKLKREGGGKTLLKMERNARSDKDWSFPNMFRKRVICMPRPPAILLPFNVSFNREAYTVDVNILTGPNNYFPSPKLWNSYKDLQQRMYSFKNEAGFMCDYPRRFRPNSPQPNANFSPFPSRSSPNPAAFQNNLLPQTNTRFSLPSEEHNFSPNMAQAPNFSLNPMVCSSANDQFPMGGLIPNQPTVNANGSLFLLENPQLHSSPKQSMHCEDPSPWMNAARHEEENFQSSSNSWQSPAPNDENFRSPQNIWMNRPHNEESGRSFINPWLNTSHNESFRSSPNLRMNSYNEGSFRPCANSSINPPCNENYRSSPSSLDFPRDQSNFQSHIPFQEPGRNFSNPWIPNWQPPWSHNNAPFGNRYPGHYQQNPMQSQFLDNPYPSDIPKFSARVSSWNDIKSSTDVDNDKNQDDEDDVQEVPIDIDEVLWSKEICPLVRPGSNLSLNDILSTLQITSSANLSVVGFNERCLPDTCNVQISFDVYMPGTIHRKSCPTVPSHRIIVTRSSDPFPKFSDIITLLRKFKDNAVLQFAVVDNGSIVFYSFDNVNLPLLVPYQ